MKTAFAAFAFLLAASAAACNTVEGVGEDMLPDNCQLKLYDDFVKVTDQEAFPMTRKLVIEEGLCVGPSSALILCGAMKYAEKIMQLIYTKMKAEGKEVFFNDILKQNKISPE